MIFVLCLTSLNVIIFRSIHVASDSIISFFFMAFYSIVYIYSTSSLSVHLPMDICVYHRSSYQFGHTVLAQ